MRVFYSLLCCGAILACGLALAMGKPPQDAAAAAQDAQLAPELLPLVHATEALRAHYADLAAEPDWPAFAPGKKLGPEALDARVPALREILTRLGDEPSSSPTEANHYDAALAEAVKRFQRRHGLADDGVIGKSTQEALGVSPAARLRQIDATLARMRAQKLEAGGRFAVVNLPEFRLHLFEGGKQAGVMKVIVGSPKNPTPTFDNAIRYVSFNPHWGVPTKIAAEELLPKITEDPNYLAENDYAVMQVSPEGLAEVDPATVDWASLSKEHFPYFLKQRPGLGNALGKIKFGLVGSNDIYLHSTSSPHLFAKEFRALSHGCIRVEQPRELMHFVFSAMKNYDEHKLNERYDSDEAKILKVDPLPVHVVYWTAWADEHGAANFRKDMYGLD